QRQSERAGSAVRFAAIDFEIAPRASRSHADAGHRHTLQESAGVAGDNFLDRFFRLTFHFKSVARTRPVLLKVGCFSSVGQWGRNLNYARTCAPIFIGEGAVSN